MILTPENYHSIEANMLYMGSSQFKSFMECEARALAEVQGKYRKDIVAFTQGAYMDAHFEGTLNIFKAKHPEIFSGKELKAPFKIIDNCINVIENDPKMLELCSGEQQKIMTGEIAGVLFKIMIDSYHPDKTVDRKAVKDFAEKYKKNEYLPWWKYWGYDYQGAIYTEIRRQNEENVVPFDLVAITKEKIPDKAWLRFVEDSLTDALTIVKRNAPRFKLIKEGLIEPNKCGECEYCISNKRLIEPEYIE